jgi:hypothetical protein
MVIREGSHPGPGCTAGLVPQLLRERKTLFAHASTSPEKHLDFLLRLGEAAVAVKQD